MPVTVTIINARVTPAEYAAFVRASGAGKEAAEDVLEDKDVPREENTCPGVRTAENISTI